MTTMNRRRLLAAGAAALILPAAAQAATPGARIDHIQVRKAARKLELISRDRNILRSFSIQLGSNPVGHKRFQGDGRTPEGIYSINRRNPNSKFHLSLGLDYPNARDRAFARSHGRSPGGDIFIHGQPNRHPETIERDWTLGCVAMSNEDMRELYRAIPIGCQVRIFS